MAYTITSSTYPPHGPEEPTLTIQAESIEDLNELEDAAPGSTADVSGTTYTMSKAWDDGSGGGGGIEFEGYVLAQYTMNSADSRLSVTDSVGVPKYIITDAQSTTFGVHNNRWDGDEKYGIAGFMWASDIGSNFIPNYLMLIIPGDSAKVEAARDGTPDNFSVVSPDSNGIVDITKENNVVAIRIIAK